MDAEDSSGKRPTSSKRKRKTSTDGAQLDSQTTVWGDKILKGPFPGGPEDPRVLRSFPSHVAAAIWHNVEREPLRVFNHTCKLQAWKFDPSVSNCKFWRYIDSSGLRPLIDCSYRTSNKIVVSAFCERWQPETNTFHLPFGELTITLDDVSNILGIPVDGNSVSVCDDELDNSVLASQCHDLFVTALGVTDDEARAEMGRFSGSAVTLEWLRQRFHKVSDDESPEFIEHAARGYLLYLLGCTLFADKTGNRISLIYLHFLRDLNSVGGYAWGAAALAYLYRQLGLASRLGCRQISGYLTLLEAWIYEHFHKIATPHVNVHYLEDQPRVRRWTPRKDAGLSLQHLQAMRQRLDLMHDNEVVWDPYHGQRGHHSLPKMTFYTGLLKCVDIVEPYYVDRVLRQFSLVQTIPRMTYTPSRVQRSTDTKMYKVVHTYFDGIWQRREYHLLGPENLSREVIAPSDCDPGYHSWYRKITHPYVHHPDHRSAAIRPHDINDPHQRIARLLAIMEPISQSNLRCACKFYEAFEQVRSILQGSEAEIAATAAAAQAEPATPVPSASTTQNIADPAAPVSSASATQDVAEPAAAQDVAEPATPVPSTSATQDVAEPAAAQDVAGRVALPLVFGSSSSFVKNSESKDNPLSLPPPPETPIFWPPDGTLSLEWVRNLMSTFDWASRNLEPNQFPDVFPMEVFDSLVLCAFNILHKEANCIAVDQLGMESTVVVVGDIHGQLHDLLFLLNDAGFPSENRLYIFNGDYVDRGAWGIETFLILLAWKVFLPKSVYLLRGNHESKYCTSVYGFEKEVLTKYGGDKGKDVYQKCLECFKRLPLTSIIGKYVYTAHGGLFRSMVAYPKRSKGKKRRKISFVPELSSKLSLGTFEELKKAQRSVLNPPWMGSNLIPGDVLWSDPSMDPGLSLNEERGIGLLWGPDCTEEFLKKFQLKLIIRSHEGPDARDKRPGLGGMDNGFTIDHTVESGKLITLFSAPDYPQFQATEDRYRNKGAYIVLEPPNFDDPVIHSFEAITPRPQANPFYDFEEVADSDQELDFASPSMETSP
ncbi:serine/threonine-protein phosphatase 7 long form homolog isoform X1 [Malus sylvestris]|uniref:serine/threonine-protein phosphatase 7 long form homolog isoform X1 n=1 Tax=Malus sylvestris TaxID=3752 RepID=UPI0021ABE50E|nr:serine/threonine-protein phosphatase 7 long form homolog isoform X1 [Malus sylvestris]